MENKKNSHNDLQNIPHSSVFFEEVNFLNSLNNNQTNEIGYNESDIQIFYDSYSKNIVRITPNEIEIYNKQARVLVKMIKITFSQEQILECTIDNSMQYLLLAFPNHILILNLNNKKKEVLPFPDDNNFKGMFFYGDTNYLFQNKTSLNFTLIYEMKTYFFKIENDKITELKNKGTKKTKSFLFNQHFLILVTELQGFKFNLYNLNSTKYYEKQNQFILPIKGIIYTNLLI